MITNIKNSMPKETKDKWLAALRSGEYKQGKGSLFVEHENSYCCMGVLQHCLTGDVERSELGYALACPTGAWLNEHNITFMLNGYKDSVPSFVLEGAYTNAIKMNDSYINKTFLEIADAIEDQIEGI
jgi:hypothetical protein